MSDKLKQELNKIKRCTQVVELSNESLGLQPNIFNGVLLGVIGSKANASNFPNRLIESFPFEPLPKRWIVERTFGGLSKDYEVYSEVSEAMIYGSLIRLMIKRLAVKDLFCKSALS